MLNHLTVAEPTAPLDGPDTSPVYNLKAVVKETGVKPDALRAWERRYGLPVPVRTSGGHRLYSQRDMQLLKWLVARQNEGLTISKAVELWYMLDRQEKLSALKTPAEVHTAIPVTDNSLAGLQAQWQAACMQFDEIEADHILAQAFALYPQETVCLDILQKSVATIGQGWYQGEATIQQEHFTSSLATRRVEGLIAATPPPTRAGQILVGCAPEEEHPFAALLLNFLLRRQGWPVIYLGAAIPLEQLEETLASVNPALVIMVAQQLHTAATLKEMADLLVSSGVNLAFGGGIFNYQPNLAAQIPGYFLGPELAQAPAQIASLLPQASLPATVPPIAPAYTAAVAHYREQIPAINAEVRHALQGYNIPPANQEMANHRFSQGIIDALTLGDIQFMSAEMDWVAGLLNHYATGPAELHAYLQIYLQALKNHLDDPGVLIINWLSEQLAAGRN